MSFNRETETAFRQVVARAREELGLPPREPPSRPAGTAASETVGTAFAVGVANGRHGGERGEIMIGGNVPADFLTGLLLHLLAKLAGGDSGSEPHMAAVANGALAGSAYRYGERQGAAMRRAAAARSTSLASASAPALPRAAPIGATFTVTEIPRGGTKR